MFNKVLHGPRRAVLHFWAGDNTASPLTQTACDGRALPTIWSRGLCLRTLQHVYFLPSLANAIAEPRRKLDGALVKLEPLAANIQAEGASTCAVVWLRHHLQAYTLMHASLPKPERLSCLVV